MSLTIGAITKIAVATAAASGAVPGTSGQLLLTCNTDCYVRFDGDTATASVFDLFMPSGSAFIVCPRSSADISVIRASADGVLAIQEIE